MLKKIKLITLIFLFPFTLIAQEQGELKTKQEPPKLKSNFVYAGYSSLLPGLGQIQKDRLYTGIFFFSAFTLSVYNLKTNFDNFYSERREYENNALIAHLFTITTLNSSTVDSIILSSVLGNQIYKDYGEASIKTNNAIRYVALIYLFQIAHAYFCSPGSSFSASSENIHYPRSSFSFNLYTNRNQSGQSGTNVDINYTWRF